ncbi:T9SS type A sorting domain-containing protein [Niastella caeni]|uniref:T9SS type A sorting domain-containing protein n=1 Tax=Niastella caeni TaxID=2569763 RepID=A0A4S8I3D3_9BACT|nr:carboxypeptidase-like regulatory domain-containing protein [Niastella caeni]THU40642.1 T9SS type A sorting domain-containing protein [Niastella caeni]
MSKAVQIQIPSPCHENWQNMTPKEQGRFCGSCQKTVIDFSIMSDKEMLDHISKAAGQHVCGRFSNDQLNTDITVTENKRRFSWAYIWNLLLATFLFTDSFAQGKPVIKKKPVVQMPDCSPRMGAIAVVVPDPLPPKQIDGLVLDSNSNQPIDGASVWIKGTTKGVITDSTGKFMLLIDETKKSVTLEISVIGYETKTLVVDSKTNWQNIKVMMAEKEMFMGLIVVAEKVPDQEELTEAEKVTEEENVAKRVNDWVPATPKKDIRIYPNPVARGNAIQANVSLKKSGTYNLELLDIGGRVVAVQKLVMTSKEQKITIPTQPDWNTGIYCIRISTPGRNIYQAKVAIQ